MSLRSLLQSSERGEVLLPILKAYLLVEEDMLASGKLTKEQIVIDDARMTIETFRERSKVYEGERHPTGEYFHPSSLGQCIRKLFFQAKNAPQNSGGKKGADDLLKWYAIMETGTYVHVMLQNLCDKAGVLVQREIGIINSKYKVIGHADGILLLNGKKYLFEIKTQNARWFSSTTGPELGHRRQITAYMKCLGLKRAVLLYYDKDRSLFKEFVVEFDEKFYQEQVAKRIKWHFSNVRTNTLPIREGVNPRMMPCTFCPYTHVCFGTQELDSFMKKIGAQRAAIKICLIDTVPKYPKAKKKPKSAFESLRDTKTARVSRKGKVDTGWAIKL